MKPRMLSSVYGEIQEILLVFPGFFTPASAQEYEGIVEVFSPKGRVHEFVLTDPNFSIRVARAEYRDLEPTPPARGGFRSINQIDAQLDLEQLLLRWRDELRDLQPGRRLTYSRWAQDPFVTLTGEGAIILLQSYSSQRAVDFLLPLQLAADLDAEFLLKPTRLCLQGGNMLCDRDTAYIGRDLIEQNIAIQNGASFEDVVAEFQRVLGVNAVKVIGTNEPMKKWPPDAQETPTWQPFFHIDLFVTLGGCAAATGEDIVFLGNIALANDLLQSASWPAKSPQSETDASIVAACNEIKNQFLEDGFLVTELPIFVRNKICYTWCNALVEVTETARCVYVPSFISRRDDEEFNALFEVLENEVARRYASQGFEVVWIRSGRFFRILAQHGGSLHCATKVLRRA